MKHLFATCCAAMFLSAAAGAHANVTYTYTGADFTAHDSTSCPDVCRLSGYIVVPTALGPNHPVWGGVDVLSFSFTDGVHTIDSANSAVSAWGTSTSINVGTDSGGVITQWNSQFFSATDFIFSGTDPAGCGGCSVGDMYGDFASTFFSGNNNSPGVWTISFSGAPEPVTWAMLILGVAMIGLAARRRSQGTAVPA